MNGQVLTVDEVAARVRLSPWAVRRAIKDFELDAIKVRGRLRIPCESLDAWLEASRIRPVVAESTRPLPRRFPRGSGRFRACLEDERAHA